MDVNEAVMDWYARKDVLYELAKATQHREITAIGKTGIIRPIKAFRYKDWRFWLDRIKPWEAPFDWYHSLAFVDLPALPPQLKKLEAARKDLTKQWSSLIRGWSFIGDIDVPDPEGHYMLAREYAIMMASRLRESRIPAYVLFSGTGWNVRVAEYNRPPARQVIMAREIAEELGLPTTSLLGGKKKARNSGGPYLDDTIYDERRIIRVPFTLNTKSDRVVTPLTLEEAAGAGRDDFTLGAYHWPVRDRIARVLNDAVQGAKG